MESTYGASRERFLQESGDPQLLAEHRKVQTRRREQQSEIASQLLETGHLRNGLTRDHALDILWVLTGSHIHEDLVTGMGWTPDQYETWLGDTLISQLIAHRRR